MEQGGCALGGEGSGQGILIQDLCKFMRCTLSAEGTGRCQCKATQILVSFINDLDEGVPSMSFSLIQA